MKVVDAHDIGVLFFEGIYGNLHYALHTEVGKSKFIVVTQINNAIIIK